MIDIKFRAWDTLQGGKYEYWDLLTNKHDGIFWTMIKNKSFKDVEQFTGLQDKKGVDIYCGDIVYIAGIGRTEVLFNEPYLSYVFSYKDEEDYFYQDIIEDLETVIGNIHESPELLNV